MRHIKITTYIFLLFAIIIVGGCSSSTSDEPTATRSGKMEIRIADDPNANPNEMIHSWWVVFVSDKNGKVMKIESKTVSEADGVSQDLVTTDVPEGIYTVYGFANLTQQQVADATGLTFAEGSKPQSNGSEIAKANILKLMWSMEGVNLNSWSKTANVPMTGYLEGVHIDRAVNQDYAIEVVRLIAKMEFMFTSTSSKRVTVNSIAMSPYTEESLEAFPTYASLGAAPHFTQTLWDKTLSHTFTGMTVDASDQTGDKTDWFYLRECYGTQTPAQGTVEVTPNASQLFNFTLNIQRSDKDAAEDVSFTVEGLNYVNRNDFIKIPVNFMDVSDLNAKVVPTFYPPIGGYPAMNVEESETEPLTTITFKSKGHFQLDPVLLLADNTEIKDRDRVKFKELKFLDAVPDADKLKLYVSGGEVVGRVYDAAVEARVEFTFMVRENASGSWQQLTRTVKIVKS